MSVDWRRMSEARNIGPKGVTSRWLGGIAMLAVAVAGAVYLAQSDLPRTWRLLLAVPLLVAGLSVFQAQCKT